MSAKVDLVFAWIVVFGFHFGRVRFRHHRHQIDAWFSDNRPASRILDRPSDTVWDLSPSNHQNASIFGGWIGRWSTIWFPLMVVHMVSRIYLLIHAMLFTALLTKCIPTRLLLSGGNQWALPTASNNDKEFQGLEFVYLWKAPRPMMKTCRLSGRHARVPNEERMEFYKI